MNIFQAWKRVRLNTVSQTQQLQFLIEEPFIGEHFLEHKVLWCLGAVIFSSFSWKKKKKEKGLMSAPDAFR